MGPAPRWDRDRVNTKRMTKKEMDRILAIYEERIESRHLVDGTLEYLAKKYHVSTRQIQRYLSSARSRREQKKVRKILKEVYPDYLKEHYAELSKIAAKLKDNLRQPVLDSLLCQVYPAEHLRFFGIEPPWRLEQDKDRNGAILRFNAGDSDPGLFLCLLSHLTYEPGTFRRFRIWQNDVSRLIESCHDVLNMITTALKERTALGVSETGGVGIRSSTLAPFVLGRILLRGRRQDTGSQLKEEAAGELTELVLEAGGDKTRLALGSAGQIELCREVIKGLVDEYASDNSINRVNIAAGDLEERARTIAEEFDIIIRKQIYQGTCRICAGWITSQ